MVEIITGDGQGRAHPAAAALRQLRSPKVPVTVILVTSGDANTLGPACRRHAGKGRVVVVALEGVPSFVIDEALAIADDFLDWDDTTVEAVQARCDRWSEIDKLWSTEPVRTMAIGRAPAFRAALNQLLELATKSAIPILLTGETGTGKEVAARLVHQLGSSREGHFVVVDSTTVVPTLSGSEFFGHERGAFTGAVSTRTGAFAAADGGTLFLDEVGELPPPLQAELLRVIQEGTYKRVGGERWHSTRFRLVCATNRDLKAETATGRFRSDLFHRIAGGVVHLPPLRERADDIEELFHHFLSDAMGGQPVPAITPSTLRLLCARSYPGNLRELKQLAFRVAARHTGPGPITPGDIRDINDDWAKADQPRAEGGDTPDDEGLAAGSDWPGSPDSSMMVNARRPENDCDSGGLPPDLQHQIERLVRALLSEGWSLTRLRRLVPDIAVRLAVEDADGSTRKAARRLGVSERAVQARRSESRAHP